MSVDFVSITFDNFYDYRREHMRYPYIFFDLDGTLTDSALGITNSVKYALEKLNLQIPTEEILRKFVGPPLSYSFQCFCNLNEAEAAEAVSVYREYFSEKGLFENEVYHGVVTMLQELKKMGKKLVVATSKPEVFSIRIMKHFQLDTYFQCIAGSSLDESRNTKEKVIRYAMNQVGVTDSNKILMVGDREHDVIGAQACNIKCLGALWGYGSKEELLDAGAFALADAPMDVIGYCE